MEKMYLLLLSVLGVLYMCDAAKILIVFPMPGKSHEILGRGFVNNLLNAGHEITHITPFPKETTNPQLHEIDISSVVDYMDSKDFNDFLNIKNIIDNDLGSMDQSIFFFMMHDIAEYTMNHENVQKLMKSPTQHFDLIIAEWMFNELYAGLAGVFNAPLIWSSSMEPHWMILSLVDEYTNPAYDGYIVDGSPPFTFTQRVTELWNTVKMSIVRETFANYKQTNVYNNVIAPIIEAKGRKAPSFSELKYNASLVLGNSHVSMGYATRIPQIYKPIGGYHISEKIQPLPEDLKNLLDNAKNGLIYFSMGSNLKSKDMPIELKQSLLEVFATLKQTVLWKFEEKLPNLPKNVHIISWAPQQSILAHPNCILFITHGGLLSTTETIFAGKPIIGIPVFADQFMNVARAVSKGFALRVDLKYTMADKLKSAINEILSDPKYSQKANELSFIYHHRPVSPSKELVHWVEHVVKTQGASHLRSPALMLPWYQKCYLDLIIIIFIVLIVIKKIIKRILLTIKPKTGKSKKNN